MVHAHYWMEEWYGNTEHRHVCTHSMHFPYSFQIWTLYLNFLKFLTINFQKWWSYCYCLERVNVRLEFMVELESIPSMQNVTDLKGHYKFWWYNGFFKVSYTYLWRLQGKRKPDFPSCLQRGNTPSYCTVQNDEFQWIQWKDLKGQIAISNGCFYICDTSTAKSVG